MKTNKIISIGLALFINAGIIAGCSTTPGTVNNPNSNSSSNANVSTGSSGNVTTPNTQDQIAINSEVQADLSDDEMTIEDSEVVANQDSSFSTKAASNKLSANSKLDSKLEVNLNKVLGRSQREKLLDDSEKVLKAKIKLNEAKLKVLKAYNKTENLKRKNLKVENSDTVEVTNSDGTVSKIKTIKFENTNNEKMTRENKVIKTYSSTGILIKVEHYLTVDGPNFDRTYTKIVNYNNDGSKQVVIKSESTWSNGRSRIVNRERSLDANGNGTGSGTIVITEKDGTTRSYDFNVTITGEIIPIPTPSPSVSPTAQPTATPTIAPTQEPTPTPTATATTSVEINSSTQINI